MASGTKFIRVHGRVVPVRAKGGGDSSKKAPASAKSKIVKPKSKAPVAAPALDPNRFKAQAKAGVAFGVAKNLGKQLMRVNNKYVKGAGTALFGAGAVVNVVKDIHGIRDAIKVGKKSGFGSGLGEYAKQTLARALGSAAGNIGTTYAVHGAAKGLGNVARQVKAGRAARASRLRLGVSSVF